MEGWVMERRCVGEPGRSWKRSLPQDMCKWSSNERHKKHQTKTDNVAHDSTSNMNAFMRTYDSPGIGIQYTSLATRASEI